MMKTQKAKQDFTASRLMPIIGAGALSLLLSACGGGYAAQREAPPPNPVLEAHLNRTVLEAHTPKAIPVEARLVLPAAQGVQGLTAQEYAQLTAFANDFVRLGRGTLVISVPANAGNSANAAIVAQDAQRALYAGGVDYAKITGGTYQAGGQPNAPIMLSFARFEAQRIECQSWSEVDARKTASNLSPDRFGCAQNANLAAMVADPGDLLGDRTDPTRDAARIQTGVDKHRKGDIPQVSAAASGGGQ
jgi:pilus assembly protein CpaD